MTIYQGARVLRDLTLLTVGDSGRPMIRLCTFLFRRCYIIDFSTYSIGAETCDFLDKLLTCNPSDRITATDALDHDYFWTDPLPADPKT
jgi:serine/threonine protein kinase